MTDEFEKAMGEANIWDYDEDPSLNRGFEEGANWAYLWCQKYDKTMYKYYIRKGREIELKLAEAEEKLLVAVEALELSTAQNRVKGYPTGSEWDDLVKKQKQVLDKIKGEND